MLRKTMLGLIAATLIGCGFASQEALARGGGGGFHGGGGGFHGGGFHGGGFHGGGLHGGGFHGGGFHGGFHGHGVWGVPYYGAWGPDFFAVPYDEYPDEYESCGWIRVKYRSHKHTYVRRVYRCW